jgi:hypothetical protein
MNHENNNRGTGMREGSYYASVPHLPPLVVFLKNYFFAGRMTVKVVP